MHDRVCPKCSGTQLRERLLPLSAQPALTLRVYLCLGCGYAECYAPTHELPALALDQSWQRIVPNAPALPATGSTVDLTQPAKHPGRKGSKQALPNAPTRRCPVCGGKQFVPDVRVRDAGQGSDGRLALQIDQDPDALIFRDTFTSHLRAIVCTTCGYTLLFADNPRDLYSAYRNSQQP